jgi:pilus assembly protein CpaE
MKTPSDKIVSNMPDTFAPVAPLSLIGICLDAETRSTLKAFSDSSPMVRVRVNLNDYYLADREAPSEWLGNPPPDVCMVDFDSDRRKAVAIAERIHSSAPETAVFAVSTQADSELILQAMRSGCSEYLVKPIDRDELLSALARVSGRRKERKDQYNAQVMAFLGAKGGCGVTTVATQLGALLAHSYTRKTLLVDLHPYSGDAALYLGLTKHKYNSYDLIENSDRLDAELLQSFVLKHSSGLEVIPAPEGEEAARAVSPEAITRTLEFLRARYELILVDLPVGLSEQNLEMVRQADQVYIVSVAEVSALRNVARQIDYFGRHDIHMDRIRVVVNRYQKRAAITDAQIEKAIRRQIFWKVPNQYPQVVKTIHGGDPISQLSTSEVMRNLTGWAGLVGNKSGRDEKRESTKETKKEGRGILGIWGR